MEEKKKVDDCYYRQYDSYRLGGRRTRALEACMFSSRPAFTPFLQSPSDRPSTYRSYQSPYAVQQSDPAPQANNRGRRYYGRSGQPL